MQAVVPVLASSKLKPSPESRNIVFSDSGSILVWSSSERTLPFSGFLTAAFICGNDGVRLPHDHLDVFAHTIGQHERARAMVLANALGLIMYGQAEAVRRWSGC